MSKWRHRASQMAIPRCQERQAAEGAALKIRIAFVANSHVLVAIGNTSPTKFPNLFRNKKQRINKHHKQSKLNRECSTISHSSLPPDFEQQRQRHAPPHRRTQTTKRIPIPPATGSRTQEPQDFLGGFTPQPTMNPNLLASHDFSAATLVFAFVFLSSSSPWNSVAT